MQIFFQIIVHFLLIKFHLDFSSLFMHNSLISAPPWNETKKYFKYSRLRNPQFSDISKTSLWIFFKLTASCLIWLQVVWRGRWSAEKAFLWGGSNITLRRPLRNKLRMRWFFDVSKVKESSFLKSDLTDPPSDFWCASFGKYQFKPFRT